MVSCNAIKKHKELLLEKIEYDFCQVLTTMHNFVGLFSEKPINEILDKYLYACGGVCLKDRE